MPKETEQKEQNKTPTFEELISTPIAEADARVRLADLNIQLAQCQKERASIDQRIADIEWVRQIILRQALNPMPGTGEAE